MRDIDHDVELHDVTPRDSCTLSTKAGRGPKERETQHQRRLLGNDPRMAQLRFVCERLAYESLPILLIGETGTGKEHTARCIHDLSERAGDFAVLDCRARSLDELEVALFGDPDGGRAGVLALADAGTLFIDEPGELRDDAQLLLFRALARFADGLNTGEPSARGCVRIISSSSVDLEALVERGSFRKELYFRLCGARLNLPPLRRRLADVPVLAEHFFTRLRPHRTFDPAFLSRYAGYDWPGNLRELADAVERYVALGDSSWHRYHGPRMRSPQPASKCDETEPNLDGVIGEVLQEGLTYSLARRRVMDAFDRAFVAKVMRESGGSVTRAAAAAGLARRYFQQLRARIRHPRNLVS